MKKSSCLALKAKNLDVWCVSSASRLYQICSNCAPWAKVDPVLGSHIFHSLIQGKLEKIFSKTTMSRALVLGM